jgi:hypothetical protein
MGTEGAINLVYALPNLHVEYVRVEPPGIPTAFWRSVGPSHKDRTCTRVVTRCYFGWLPSLRFQILCSRAERRRSILSTGLMLIASSQATSLRHSRLIQVSCVVDCTFSFIRTSSFLAVVWEGSMHVTQVTPYPFSGRAEDMPIG